MRIVLILAFFLSMILLKAQTNPYPADLAALRSVLEKTPSYKAQIKGDKLSSYNQLYESLVSDTITNPHTYLYFYNLSQLVFPLKDNHIGFYQLPHYDNFRSKESIDSFIRTEAFSEYPKLDINIDSLKIELAKKPADSIEGIYYYDRFYSVGLLKGVTESLSV